MKGLIICVLFVLTTHGIFAKFNPSDYTNSAQLDSFYSLYWTVDESKDLISLGIMAKAIGWAGFGLGEPTSGSMPGADMLVAIYDPAQNIVTISDRYNVVSFTLSRYALHYAEPSVDQCQNWNLVAASVENDM
jgi:hypothetical protein